jgi:hypothetical protein
MTTAQERETTINRPLRRGLARIRCVATGEVHHSLDTIPKYEGEKLWRLYWHDRPVGKPLTVWVVDVEFSYATLVAKCDTLLIPRQVSVGVVGRHQPLQVSGKARLLPYAEALETQATTIQAVAARGPSVFPMPAPASNQKVLQKNV